MYRGKYEAVASKGDPIRTRDAVGEQVAVPVEERSTAPAPRSHPEAGDVTPRRRRRRKRIAWGKLVFYGIWLLLIVAFFIGMGIVKGALLDWLVEFEASQPDNQSAQMFERYFADPDWAELYRMAGIEDTAFEGVQAYSDYMEQTVGSAEITMVETSAGLTGGKKYVIRATLGEQGYFNFATFTLVDKKAEDDLISDWQLGEVQIFTWNEDQSMQFSRDLGYAFLVAPDSVVTVNGVVLDESYVQRTVSTVAENYLPEGVHGYRLAELRVEGLLTEPTILVTNAQGQAAELDYDAEKRTFTERIVRPTITDEEYTTVVKAAQTYCRYMIGAVGAWDLRSYFDHTTQIYDTITTNTTWMQGYTGYDFGEETVSDFYRYSDSLYSARVTLALNVTRPDGTVKVYELGSSFFLELQTDGWRVIEMTNVDVQAQTSMVRLTYVDGDTVLASQMVAADSRRLTPPEVTVPEGQTFLGWYVEAGRLETDTDGTIQLPTDLQLEPMTVYALFGAEEG